MASAAEAQVEIVTRIWQRVLVPTPIDPDALERRGKLKENDESPTTRREIEENLTISGPTRPLARAQTRLTCLPGE